MSYFWNTPESEPYVPPVFRNYLPPTPYVPWYQQQPPPPDWSSSYTQPSSQESYYPTSPPQPYDYPPVMHTPQSQPHSPSQAAYLTPVDIAQKILDKLEEMSKKIEEHFERENKQLEDQRNNSRLQDLCTLRQTDSVAQFWIEFSRYKTGIRFESEQQIINIFVAGLKSDIQQELRRASSHCTSLIFTYRLALFYELCDGGYFEEPTHITEEEHSLMIGIVLNWLYFIMKMSIPYFRRSAPLQIQSTYLFWWFGRYQFSRLFIATTLRTRLFSRGVECYVHVGNGLSRRRTLIIGRVQI